MTTMALKQALAVGFLGSLAYVIFGDIIQAGIVAFIVLIAVVWMER
jgi:hypothetical protein